MLLDDDIVTNGEAKASALSGGFGCEKGIEHFSFYLVGNASAVVAYADLNMVAEIFGRCCQGGLEITVGRLSLALRRGIETI
jgi:hypothetical protein